VAGDGLEPGDAQLSALLLGQLQSAPALCQAQHGMHRDQPVKHPGGRRQVTQQLENGDRVLAAAGELDKQVPYGGEYYGYFMRRLAERPANLTFFLRALVGKR
jgi:hypothetical protein